MMLARRQHQVVALIAEGAEDKEIGRALGIHPRTVKAHVQAAMRNTRARNRVQLAVLYVRGEITTERAA